jgi:hypothetical protein
MGELITDPLILQQIEREQAAKAAAGGGSRGEAITDPMVLDQIRKQRGGATTGEKAYDFARQTVGAIPQTLAQGAMLPFRGLGALSRATTGGSGIEPYAEKVLSPWLEQPEAETPEGRYGHRIGESIGMALPVAGAFMRGAKGLSAIAPALPQTGMAGLKEAALRPIAQNPGTALSIDALSAVGGGAAAQAAEEAGGGAGAQTLAGLAGGFAAPLGGVPLARAIPGLMRSESGAVPLPRFGGAPDPGKVEDRAYRIIADKAIAAGVTPEQLEARLATGEWSRKLHSSGKPPDATVLADLDESLARLAGSAVRQHQEAANIARPIISGRQTGETPLEGMPSGTGIKTYGKMDPARFEPKAEVAGQHSRLIEAHRRALRIQDADYHGHGKTAGQTADLIVAKQEKESGPAYDAFRKAGGMYDLSKNKVVNAVVKKWQDLADSTNIPEVKREIQAALARFAPDGTTVKNVKDFDLAKRFTDSEIKAFMQAGSSKTNEYIGRQLLEMKNELVGAVDSIKKHGIGAKYAKARSIYSSHAEALEDIQLGRDIFTGKADPAAFKGLTTREAQKRARLGYHSEYADTVKRKQPGQDATRDISPLRRQEELTTLIERPMTKTGRVRTRKDPDTGEMIPVKDADRPQRYGAYVKGEEAMIRTRDIVKGGSPTAERLADDAAFDVLHTLADVMQGGAIQTTKRALEYSLNKMFGMQKEVSAEIARKLFSADPKVRTRVIAEMRMRMGKDRFAELSQMMATHQRRALTGGTGAGLTAGEQE